MEKRDFLRERLDRILGPKTAAAFSEAFGYQVVADLLGHFPRRYVKRGELSDIESIADGEEATILAEILSAKSRRIPGKRILEVIVTDGKAKLILTFFNQAWREKELKPGKHGLFAGKITRYQGKRQLAHPEYQLINESDGPEDAASNFAGKLIPIYPASGKLRSWKIEQSIGLLLDTLGEIPDAIPNEMRLSLDLPSKSAALISIHRPDDLNEAGRARRRLAFDEALLLQLILLRRKVAARNKKVHKREEKHGKLLDHFDHNLPFNLTEGQIRVWGEIKKDIYSNSPMYRLLQGEVGSGKTVIAIRAMLAIVESGGQAALLAPTEVLAQQHFRNLSNSLGSFVGAGTLGAHENSISLRILTGSLPEREKELIRNQLANGEVDIVIGTHALLSESVAFKDLGLVVIDEQHRFGVEQRDALRAKSEFSPHVLVMTATPIPRTVAMTVFGDLDISTLDQLPQGRAPISTHVIPVLDKPHFLERAWQRIREEVKQGRQAYVVAPRIAAKDSSTDPLSEFEGASDELLARLENLLESEESSYESKIDMASVEEFFPMLASGPLSGLRVAALHGRMPVDEKESVMNSFSAGEIDVLISTTVIEVGVDVANATVMVILDADRFGVSQLHQLRGRVGRGSNPGLCLLVTRASSSSPAMDRLEAVASTLDGFELSRLDLEQRREGDVLGASQSGAKSHLRLLRVVRDEELILLAREKAAEILASDATLGQFPLLAAEIAQVEQESEAEVSYMEKG